MKYFTSTALLASTLALALTGLSAPAFGAQAASSPQLIYIPDNSSAVDHAAIIRSFEEQGFTVSTYAYAGEDRVTYARRIAHEVRDMMSRGHEPSSISVMGGGSGSDIVLLTSAITGNRHVNFVALGSCNRALKDSYSFRLSGNVLALREADDSASESCRPLFIGSPRLNGHRDLVLNTPYGKDLFAGAHNEWIAPAAQWMSDGKVDVGEVKVALLEH